MAVKVKRIYKGYEKSDGFRILVDRLWPRGIKKEDANIDLWMKEIAPSTALRKWFAHDPAKWTTFVSKYKKEIKGSPALHDLTMLMGEHKTLTLVFSAKDEQHNQANALKKFVDEEIHRH